MENESKLCQNCKRDIPTVNYMVHSAHCVRNIKPCMICKEPIPIGDMKTHHKKFHEIVPCKQCGEGVCGTDLEDHIRDSCAKTIKACRYCDLELPRCDIPEHEDYCGTRTERCSECSELIMIKYLQLHLDSNHTFLKLNDEPGPSSLFSSDYTNNRPFASNSRENDEHKQINSNDEIPSNQLLKKRNNDVVSGSASRRNRESAEVSSSSSNNCNSPKEDKHRKQNDKGDCISRVQEKNSNIGNGIDSHRTVHKVTNSINKKSRPAPPPPTNSPSQQLPPRDQKLFWSAELRRQKEEKERQEKNAYNLANGLPPVLNAAEKLAKLKNMSRLMNIETEPSTSRRNGLDQDVSDRNKAKHVAPPSRLGNYSVQVTPMSRDEFDNRFQRVQVKDVPKSGVSPTVQQTTDRFSNLRTELQQLRRGLNQVTAPYNNDQRNVAPIDVEERRSQLSQEQISIPCEFCGRPMNHNELILHQTGCRPDMCKRNELETPPNAPTRQRTSQSRETSANSARDRAPSSDEAFLPCEFCNRSFPLSQLMHHQVDCLLQMESQNE